MDFYKIRERTTKKNSIDIYADFVVGRTKDIMVRGKTFYAVWDEEAGMWSTDEYDVARIVDKDLYEYANKKRDVTSDYISVKALTNFSTKAWEEYKRFIVKVPDNAKALDTKITFSNTEVKRSDYVSKRLPYPLEEGNCEAYEEIMSTLYSPEERAKLEWAIGAIISGDAKKIQKFIVLYGDAGAGKSTVLNIIQKLFEGYYTTFDAKELTSSANAFATSAFNSNPLVAIQHDGDLSGIKDNSILNSIVSHEEIIINEKFKSQYTAKAECFLFMATNKPVKITDGKSGLIRRLIDVKPSGKKLTQHRYNELMGRIDFELGAIAKHCLDIYKEMGADYYSAYRPLEMMFETDPFFNFIEYNYEVFDKQDCVTLKSAYTMYKEYCEEAGMEYKLQMYKFRAELKNYFKYYDDEMRLEDGRHVRSFYSGFERNKFFRTNSNKQPEPMAPSLIFLPQASLFDDYCKDCEAQYASQTETPSYKWDNVKTKLSDLDTSKLHYVKIPENHIVIDFDLKDENGKKSYEKNLEAASKWPKTYAELSKSGAGIHLHYIYTGDPTMLKRLYDKDIEVKVFTGNSSLRRKLIKCNDIPIANISSGLPLKEGEKVLTAEGVKSEKGLRKLIIKNLNKEIHPGTKPSIDFIYKILEDAYNGGLKYDVSDMETDVMAFAINSTHQSEYCVDLVLKMKFKSDEPTAYVDDVNDERPLIFYDVEVFPNLFLINWKKEGEDCKVVRMINPTPIDVEELIKNKLVGFNCRRYDNHILYARLMGYSNEQLYHLSQRIVSGDKNAFFGEAYNLSYTDVYDFSSKKQSLKKFEIELGIHHQELGLPWDQPVPEDMWIKVAEYCDNDVIATEATFNARQADFLAREILVEICKHSGLEACVNDTTNSLTTKIIFGREKHPELVYTDLSELFPGYSFERGEDGKFHNLYRDEDVGMGGYVYAEPGMYGNIALLDIASMHPTSIINMNCFGEYTARFKDIYDARILIKHKDYEGAGNLMGGVLKPFLKDENQASQLAQALKIAINSVYGLTSATFANPFRDPRNVNNIVALRGALFMVNLKHEVQERGYKVAHIKTDSIKIPDATTEIIEFVMEYGKRYGYTFEHEATYEKMCLVNDAVYIAKYVQDGGKHGGEWTATGTQFQVPYVFKTLFSKEELVFEDMCETKTVSSALYLDMNENLPDVSSYEKEKAERIKGKLTNDPNMRSITDEELDSIISSGHIYNFVGKAGQFCPIKPGCGGGELLREKDGKYYAATGSKGFRWLESETVKNLGKENDIDTRYYENLVEEAKTTISQYGDFEWFASDDPYVKRGE